MTEHFPALPGGDQKAALYNQFAITQKNQSDAEQLGLLRTD